MLSANCALADRKLVFDAPRFSQRVIQGRRDGNDIGGARGDVGLARGIIAPRHDPSVGLQRDAMRAASTQAHDIRQIRRYICQTGGARRPPSNHLTVCADSRQENQQNGTHLKNCAGQFWEASPHRFVGSRDRFPSPAVPSSVNRFGSQPRRRGRDSGAEVEGIVFGLAEDQIPEFRGDQQFAADGRFGGLGCQSISAGV